MGWVIVGGEGKPSWVVAMRRGVSIEVLTLSVMILYFAMTLTVAFVTGGLWPGGLYFLALSPALAVIMLGREAGFRWMAATLISIGAVCVQLKTVPYRRTSE